MLTRLKKHIQDQDTGCLSTADAFGIPLQVFFLQGSLVAAHAGDDTQALLRILLKRGWVEEEQLHNFKAKAEFVGIYETLLENGESTRLRDAFYDRFRENICRVLEAKAPASFETMEAVMIPNIQLCHDTEALISEAQSVVERTRKLRSGSGVALVQKGARNPLSPAEKRLLKLTDKPLPLQSIVRQSPFESFQSWDLLSDMMERSVLESVEAESSVQSSRAEPVSDVKHSQEPRLSRNEAEDKIHVLNEVVSAFHKASDVCSGPGAGRAQLRLLLDGSPRQYALLFNGLPLGVNGQLDTQELVLRLRNRIGPERRRLLNAGLRDLIQRTLSMADESLAEPQMTQLLRDISGHESRLGW